MAAERVKLDSKDLVRKRSGGRQSNTTENVTAKKAIRTLGL